MSVTVPSGAGWVSSARSRARRSAAETIAAIAFPCLVNRDFTLLWSGQLASQLGSSTTLLAVPLLVLR